MVTVWWSAAHLFHYSFLDPSKIITSEKYVQQIDEMHWKLQHLQATLVNKKGPVLLYDIAWLHVAQPMLQKLKELGYRILPHLPYSPVLLPNNYHFFKHQDNFLQGKCFHKQQKAENASQESSNPKEINLFLIGKKKVLIVMVFILINKDAFEPSYNDLKYVVWNHNYICTNLITLLLAHVSMCILNLYYIFAIILVEVRDVSLVFQQ